MRECLSRKVARTWRHTSQGGRGRTSYSCTTYHGNSWATANTTKILPYMGMDMGHYQLYSPEYTDSHGSALLIGQSTNRTMHDWWTIAQAGQTESVAH